MRTKAKLFITSLLLLIVTSLAGNAASAPTQAVVSSRTADRQVTTGTSAYSHSQDNQTYCDGEMCFSSLLEAFVQNNQFRARRVAHFSVLFKTSMYKLCLQYKRAELMDKCKVTGAYTPVRNLQTCSDYYIFALRRILI